MKIKKATEVLINKIRKVIIKKNIPFFKQWIEREFYNSLKINHPVLVLQMGKVASNSIFYSLRKSYNGRVIHAHQMLKYGDKSFKKAIEDTHMRTKILYKAYEDGTHIKIISLIREPISRNIAFFFQTINKVTGYKDLPHSATTLLRFFLEHHNHHYPLVWFDHQMKKNFNIDVYAKPFPSRGYDFFKQDNAELLLMKYDLDDKIKEALIAEYLGMKSFTLHNKNIGKEKKYAKSYLALQKLPLPTEYIDSMLNSKYAQHFYQKECAQIKKRHQKI